MEQTYGNSDIILCMWDYVLVYLGVLVREIEPKKKKERKQERE